MKREKENLEEIKDVLQSLENTKPEYSNWLFKIIHFLEVLMLKLLISYRNEIDRAARPVNIILSSIIYLNSILIILILSLILNFFHKIIYER